MPPLALVALGFVGWKMMNPGDALFGLVPVPAIVVWHLTRGAQLLRSAEAHLSANHATASAADIGSAREHLLAVREVMRQLRSQDRAELARRVAPVVAAYDRLMATWRQRFGAPAGAAPPVAPAGAANPPQPAGLRVLPGGAVDPPTYVPM